MDDRRRRSKAIRVGSVEGLDTLTQSLARRTPDQLAALLVRHAEPLSRRPAPTTLRALATALWSYETLHHLVLHLDAPRLHLLAAAAHRSRRLAGDQAPAEPGSGLQSRMGHSLSFPRLAGEPVPVEDVLAAFSRAASAGDTRDVVETALRALGDQGLAAVSEDGLMSVPPRIGQLLGALDRARFTPSAPRPDTTPVDPSAVRTESRAATAQAATALDRLLAALAERPATLRKSGGLAVREIKRLSQACGVSEPHTRLLLDLAQAAGLIALTRDPSATTATPTTVYDPWLDATPGDRLAPVLKAWWHLNAIPTCTPFGETATALVRPQDRYAPALRHALFAVLAELPDNAAVPVPRPEAERLDSLDDVLASARWYRPLAFADQPQPLERSAHTLDEAAFLGLLAHGALTPLGRALAREATAPGTEDGDRDGSRGAAGDGDHSGDHDNAHDEAVGLASTLDDLLPPPIERAHFQADLTAVVPGTPSHHLARLLNSAADRESQGQAVTWRFTPASVRRALDAGHSAPGLAEELTAVSPTGALPQPLTYLIEDTARTHGHIRVVTPACCVRSEDETLLKELTVHRALAELRLRPLAGTVLASALGPRPTLDALRAAGYAPTLESETGMPTLERIPARRSQAPAPPRTPADHLALARRLLEG